MKKFLVLGAIAVFALAGCKTETKESAVPNVVGQRLDVAESHVKDAGLKSEAIGGGTFGIVAKSNWTVCQTEPAAGATGAKSVRLIVDRVCTTPEGDAGNNAATTPDTAADTTTSTSETTSTTSAAGVVQAARIRVPSVVGKDLQTAQDTMQAAGLYNLTSHDSTGLNRMQVLDRNWLVTDQSPRAGTMVDESQLIDLGARKYTD